MHALHVLIPVHIAAGLSAYATKPNIDTSLYSVVQSAYQDTSTSSSNRPRPIVQAKPSSPFGTKKVRYSDGLLKEQLAKTPLATSETSEYLWSTSLTLTNPSIVPIFDATEYWGYGPKSKHILQLDDLTDCPQITEEPPPQSLVAVMYTAGKYKSANYNVELLSLNVVSLVLLCRPRGKHA